MRGGMLCQTHKKNNQTDRTDPTATPMNENLPTQDEATARMIEMMEQLLRHSETLEQATDAHAQKLSELEQKIRELDGQFRNSRNNETFR